jgi:glycosyltransferase involved in cell wall biosynthesis
MANLLVSVVIPTYNSGPLVVEAVKSVLAQTRPADEIIVVDDGSTDDTAARLRAFGNRIKVVAKRNGGVATARNRGVQEASGDAIAFLDADDVWHPRKLEIQTKALASRPDLLLLGTKTFSWPADVMPEVEVEQPPIREMTFEQLISINTLNTSSIVVRTEALMRAGEFDSALQGPEDYDLWIRMALLGSLGVLDAQLTGYFRNRPGSLSKDASRMERDTLKIIAKHKSMGTFMSRVGLYRKMLGMNAYRAAFRYFEAGMNSRALSRVGLSLLYYPLPFPLSEVSAYFARPRFVLAVIRRMLTASVSRAHAQHV